MKKLTMLAALLFGVAIMGAEAPAAANELVFDLEKAPVTKTITVQKPADEAGKVPVLQLKAFYKHSTNPGGWTQAVSYRINGKYITEKTAAGTPRLLRNKQGFTYGAKNTAVTFFKSNRWLTIYSKDGETTDPRLVKNGITDATSFSFDLSGMLPAQACEQKLAITNILLITHTKKNMPLIIRDVKIVMMPAAEVAKMLGK